MTDTTGLESSVLALPRQAAELCDTTEELLHRPDPPTRHNDLCDGRSAWEVVAEHPDFESFVEREQNETTEPVFTILRQPNSQPVVFVLDFSNSMSSCHLMPDGAEA